MLSLYAPTLVSYVPITTKVFYGRGDKIPPMPRFSCLPNTSENLIFVVLPCTNLTVVDGVLCVCSCGISNGVTKAQIHASFNPVRFVSSLLCRVPPAVRCISLEGLVAGSAGTLVWIASTCPAQVRATSSLITKFTGPSAQI